MKTRLDAAEENMDTNTVVDDTRLPADVDSAEAATGFLTFAASGFPPFFGAAGDCSSAAMMILTTIFKFPPYRDI